MSQQLESKIKRNIKHKERRRKRIEEVIAHRKNSYFDVRQFKANFGRAPIPGERLDFSEVPGLKKMDQYRLTAERLKQLDSVSVFY